MIKSTLSKKMIKSIECKKNVFYETIILIERQYIIYM